MIRTGASRLVPLLFMLVAALCAGCGDKSPTVPSPGGVGNSVQVFFSQYSPLVAGATAPIFAHQLSGSTQVDCTASAEWWSSDPSIAAVAKGGVVTGVSPGTVTVNATCAGVTGSVSLFVWEAASLTGTVADEHGSPVSRANVGVALPSPQPRDSGGRETLSDAQGRYRLTLLARGRTYNLTVLKGGYEDVRGSVTVAAPETVLDIPIHPGVELVIVVKEPGIGTIAGATVEIISGANAGRRAESDAWGMCHMEHLVPERFTVRVSKPGYEPLEVALDGTVNVFRQVELKSSYGSCLLSVSPASLEELPSAGGEATVLVNANPDRSWSATSSAPWISFPTGGSGKGPGSLLLRLLPAAAGERLLRTATMRVGCSPDEGANLLLSQLPACEASLSWAPDSATVFPAAGGVGRVLVRTGVPACYWRAVSRDAWITSTTSAWQGDLDLSFRVAANPTGVPRVGTIVMAEKAWEVKQGAQQP